ncbi:hypothetical protein [Nostoc sp.]|uniref:hypothetical protein n=1 Tax=Nostoc sp. TaxID=1180 RepID=UPI002FF58217
MRSLRFIFIGIITSLFVTNVVFLRRTLSVLLCGVLSFNSASCYSFLNIYGKADAAAPPSSAVVTSKDLSVVQKDEQKIADCFLGVCVNLPKSPIPIPGVPSGNPIDIAKTAVIKEIGEAVGVGSPLLLDQKTAYPDVSDQVKDFHPKPLAITSDQDLQKPLPPGDYSLDVIAYCTQFSIHAPGRGLPYKLAPLTGKQAPAISALLSRGTLQGIAPATLNANSWRIQAGLPLKQWSQQDQALIHKLIPEYEKGLEGDYLQQIENTYNQFRLVPGIPSLNDLLRQSGAPGQTVLQLRQARQALTNQTISAERLPDMLYEPTGDGLPRVLPAAKDSSPSHWAEIKSGVFARFTVIEGNLGRNLLEFRVTPQASAAINNSATVVAQNLDKNLQVGDPKTTVAVAPIPLALILNGAFYIGYSIGRAAQALIFAAPINYCPYIPIAHNTSRVISASGPYKLTIYVTGADNTPGIGAAFPGGHAWISLSDGQTTNYYGFSAAFRSSSEIPGGTLLELPYIFFPIGIPGIFQDESGRPYNVFQEYTITQQGLRDAYQAIVDWDDTYNLAFHNCATFASTVGIVSGALPSKDINLLLSIINPASLANYLLSHGGKSH